MQAFTQRNAIVIASWVYVVDPHLSQKRWRLVRVDGFEPGLYRVLPLR